MRLLAWLIVCAPVIIAALAYVGYPAALWLIATVRRRAPFTAPSAGAWPSLTITVPVHNGAATIGAALDRLLALDYPRGLVQLLVISDASTDGTDDLVRARAGEGVELLRLPRRVGKTAAENAAMSHARGEIIVNVDATVQVPRESLRPLVRVFRDPAIGLASGRDVSVASGGDGHTDAESGYVGYEMWVRSLESRVGSIVGASGCFYAIRRSIHSSPLAPDLSWDFASALVAHELGYRSVSVSDAICLVPRTAALRTERRRKVRTMARGLRTLLHMRALLNPRRHGGFALMLICHKLLRWLPWLVAPVATAALLWLAMDDVRARLLLAMLALGVGAGALALRRPSQATMPLPLRMAGFIVATASAGVLAWWEALRSTPLATWEPTPRAEALP